MHDAAILIITLPLLIGNVIWAFSVLTCPRFSNPEGKPNRYCTACHGLKWPWKY